LILNIEITFFSGSFNKMHPMQIIKLTVVFSSIILTIVIHHPSSASATRLQYNEPERIIRKSSDRNIIAPLFRRDKRHHDRGGCGGGGGLGIRI
jgi:hypothetical protein